MIRPVLEIVLGAGMVGAVAALLAGVRSRDRALEIASKAAASACFVALGMVRCDPGSAVELWLIAGLVACAAGDLLLLAERTFDLGLAAFLLGHVAYIAAFGLARPPASWPLAAAAPLAVAGVLVARWLWPRLGRRRASVTVYIAIISFMVWGAFAAAGAGRLPATVAAGALLFYLSDLAVARRRFAGGGVGTRMAGLLLYYAGQLLIALAV